MLENNGSGSDEKVDVLVAGGGLAGLTAANYLARAGYSVQLCEAAATPGGRARTTVTEGFGFNMGPHALYRRGVGVQVLDELGVSYTGGTPAAEGWLTRGGERWPLPGSPLALLTSRLLSLRERARALRFFGALARIDTDALQTLSLDDWLARQGMDGNLASVIRTLVRLTAYCHDTASLPAGVALAQLRLGTGGVLYLDGGWQTLVAGLADSAGRHGVRIRCKSPVRRVSGQPGALDVTLGDGRMIRARAVVLAVAPGVALEILDGAAGDRLRRFAASAEPVQQACLDLGLATLPAPGRVFALGMDDPFYCSLHSASAELAPPGGHLFQLGRYGGDPDGHTRARLERWLDQLQPGWREHILTSRYLRAATVMNAMPSTATGGLRGRPAPADVGLPGVLLCGDWVGSCGILSEASFASGRQAAREGIMHLQEAAA